MFSDDFSAELGSLSSSTVGSVDSFSSGMMHSQNSAKGADSFWKSVIAFESAPHTTHLAQLERAGHQLPDPASLSDGQLTEKLWEVINGLAGLRVYLRHTNHLSDRELYELLWWDLLRQETVDTTNLPGTRCNLDILGGRDQAQRFVYLKYYADEQERRFFSEQYPDSELPDHLDPPFERDMGLPG